jgi:hypothetical protein
MLGLAERLKNNPRRAFSPDASHHLRQHESPQTLRLMQVLTGRNGRLMKIADKMQSRATRGTGASCLHPSEYSCMDKEASSLYATTPLHHWYHLGLQTLQ